MILTSAMNGFSNALFMVMPIELHTVDFKTIGARKSEFWGGAPGVGKAREMSQNFGKPAIQ